MPNNQPPSGSPAESSVEARPQWRKPLSESPAKLAFRFGWPLSLLLFGIILYLRDRMSFMPALLVLCGIVLLYNTPKQVLAMRARNLPPSRSSDGVDIGARVLRGVGFAVLLGLAFLALTAFLFIWVLSKLFIHI
jgi:hypothetical protein